MYIYIIENNKNNKKYIGQTSKNNPVERIKQHLRECDYGKRNLPLYNSIRKNGWYSFYWKVVCVCDDKDELNEMEYHFIKQYNSIFPNGYNMTSGGNCRELCDATKKKISKSNTGKKRTEEQKIQMSIVRTGVPVHTEEWKKHLSETLKGNTYTKGIVWSKESIEKRKKSLIKFYQENPESLEIRSEISKKLWEDFIYREKVCESLKGRTVSEETKLKISESLKGENSPLYGKKRSEETKLKISKKNSGVNNPFYGKKHTNESLLKMSEKLKGKNNPFYGKKHTDKSILKKNGFFYIIEDSNNDKKEKIVSLKKWSENNNFSYENVKYHVKKHNKFKNFIIKRVFNIDEY